MSDPNIPSSERVIAGFMAYRVTAALRTAVEIDLFTSIAEGCVTAEALAARCSVHPRGARILADYLVIFQFGQLLCICDGSGLLESVWAPDGDCPPGRRALRRRGT